MVMEQLIALLAEHTGKDAGEINVDTTFASLGIDSLDTVDLVMELEEKLNVELTLDQKVTTVGEMANLLESKLAG